MKIKRRIVSLMLVFVLQPIPTLPSTQLPDAFFLQQQNSNSCTLCASTMLIRGYLYENSCKDWELVTEQTVGKTAWTEQGLLWQWKWSDTKNVISVAHRPCSGLTEQEVIDLLDDHPEGITLYCGGSTHHAVYLSQYKDSTFYCADPAVGYAGSLIPLDASLLGERLGTQASILQNVTAYWYVVEAMVQTETKM